MTKTRRADAELLSVSRGGSVSFWVSAARGSVSGLAKAETRAEASPTRSVCPPRATRSARRLDGRPATATAQVERDGESRPSLLVTVRGDDLELCVGVAAETNGWPCAATLRRDGG